MIHIVMGISGSGKTTAAKYLARKLNAEVINTDTLHGLLFPNGERTETGDFTPEQLAEIYRSLRPLAYYLSKIAPDRHIVFEGNFRFKAQREFITEMMESEKLPYKVLFVELGDEGIAEQRITNRHLTEDILKVKFKFIENLTKYKNSHTDIGLRMMKADDGRLFALDLFYLGLLQRSISTIKGFLTEIETDNYLCAAPLVRIHLDTFLQTYAAFVVDNPHDYATEKLKGGGTNKIKGSDGKLLQDSHIIELMDNDSRIESKWVKNLYFETSKFIHASDKHIFSTVTKGEENGEISFMISEKLNIPDESIVEGLSAMVKITKSVIRLWEGWILTKDTSRKSRNIKKTNNEER
jgi:predicted kinase